MKEDYLKEKIKFNTEIIKLLVIVVLATGGGVVSLINQELTIVQGCLLLSFWDL